MVTYTLLDMRNMNRYLHWTFRKFKKYHESLLLQCYIFYDLCNIVLTDCLHELAEIRKLTGRNETFITEFM
jgi:hypothetical protein